MFQQGQQIGSYTLIRKLGRGGFGEVWLAEKRSQFVTKKVAVKLPLDEQINFDSIRQEAELWEQASGHPNVLPIIDADIVAGQVLIVSEFADGGSLHDRLKTQGKLPIKQTVELTTGILNGLEFLHNRKIIHRDIKPQNILLQGDTPRLADFGISRAMQTTSISSKLVGTDAYMSPEAFDGKRSVQTDIWSVGVVLYQLLAGSLPFPQEHPSERIFAILSKEFPPLPNDVPSSLRQIVSKSLAKQPENRYQTANEMREELQRVLVGIEHPTLAKTEVLQIPPESLPTIITSENKYSTNEPEKETVVNNRADISVLTQLQPEKYSVVTQLKQAQFTEQNSLPTKAEQIANNTQSAKLIPSGLWFGLAAVGGLIGLIITIALLGSILSPAKTSQSNPASNANSASPLMNIEMVKLPSVSLKATIDGKNESVDNLARFTAQNSFVLEYSIYEIDKFQLWINGKLIKLSKTPPLGGYTSRFEVTKDNLNKVLQSGSNENSPTSTAQMNIELGVTEGEVYFVLAIDGKREEFHLSPSKVKNYTPRQSLNLSYYRGLADKVQLKINNQIITPPRADQGKGGWIEFEITKDNLNEILQRRKILATE